MAPLYHAERGLAHFLLTRSSLLGTDAVSSSSSDVTASAASPAQHSSSGNGTPPLQGVYTLVGALVGVIVLLSIFILALVAWKLWARPWNMDSAKPDNWGKQWKPVGLFDSANELADIKNTSPPPPSDAFSVVPPTKPKVVLTRTGTDAIFKVTLPSHSKRVYPTSDGNSVTSSSLLNSTVSTIPPALRIAPPPTYPAVAAPALSPRTGASKPLRTSHLPPMPKFPRLVVVDSVYTPTFHDELEIRKGETLRLLEEFEDEWCLVQRVGPKNAEKGVVPRVCVIDKLQFTPSKFKHIIAARVSRSTPTYAS